MSITKQCVLVGPGPQAEGQTGVTCAAGISSATAGARGLCLQLASLPPGGRSRAHRHDEHESAVAVLARTDPDEQESVTELPALDAIAGTRPGR